MRGRFLVVHSTSIHDIRCMYSLDIICIDISFIIVYSKRGVDIAWPRQNYTFIRADRA